MQKKLIQMEVALAIEFVLGMITNLFGISPEEAVEHPVSLFVQVASGVHELLGLVILIGAVFTFTATLKQDGGKWKLLGIAGLVSVLMAFGGGMATLSLKDNASEIASLVMSLGFLFAFCTYGWFILKLNQKTSAS